MHEFRKLYTLLQMIGLLSSSTGYSPKQLSQKYGVTVRTIYRYFELLKAVGFSFEKEQDGRYKIVKGDSYFTSDSINFSLEEAAVIKDAILAVHASHPLKNLLLAKLFAHSEIGSTAEILYNQILGKNVAVIARAIRNKKQLLLKNYHSLNSNTIKDRLVEPIGFVQNMRYFSAYEPAKKESRLFKPDRVQEVEILPDSFKYANLHQHNLPDAFGMVSGETVPVDLRLSARAANLLGEEFPLAAPGINPIIGTDKYSWSGKVNGFEGVGRFILGLPGEIEVTGPGDLQQYLKNKLLPLITVTSASAKKLHKK